MLQKPISIISQEIIERDKKSIDILSKQLDTLDCRIIEIVYLGMTITKEELLSALFKHFNVYKDWRTILKRLGDMEGRGLFEIYNSRIIIIKKIQGQDDLVAELINKIKEINRLT